MWEDDAVKKSWARDDAVIGEDPDGNIVPAGRKTNVIHGHAIDKTAGHPVSAFNDLHAPVKNKGYMSKAPTGGGHAPGHSAPREKSMAASLPRARHPQAHANQARHPHGT